LAARFLASGGAGRRLALQTSSRHLDPDAYRELLMTAAIIDGKAFAEALRARVAGFVPAFVEQTGRKPGLAVVLVGDDPASRVYVRSKGKATVAVGMESFEHCLPESTSQKELLLLVGELNADPRVDGILVSCRCRRKSMTVR
jgi:hypothetical protein